jgi:hypothetical protein
VGAASTVREEAVSIGPEVEADPVIWTARLRTGRVVTFRASGSRVFRAAAAADLADSVVIAAAADSAAAIASAVADLVAAVLEDLVAEGAGGVDEDNAWNSPILFLEKLKTH